MMENESFQNPISLEELHLLLHHPPSNNSIFHNEDLVTSLSHIPWSFQQSIQITSEEPTSPLSKKFPAFSYLDLRRHQNRAWANDRLLKGNEQYYLNPEQADKLYQEGIDLVPDHVDLLVAQAKLWLMRRSRLESAKLQLKHALQLNATHADAKHWMNRLEQHEVAIAAARRGDVRANHQAQTRNSTAYQNVLMERNLLIASSLHNDEEPAGSDSSSSSLSSRRRSKRQKKTKQKKKHRKHKKESKSKGRKRRRRYDTSSASDESSNDASIGSGRMGCDCNKEEEKGDVPTRSRKRRRRKRYCSDASSTLGDDDSGVRSSRIRGQKEPNRQTDDSLGDDDSRSHRRHRKLSRSYREKAKKETSQERNTERLST